MLSEMLKFVLILTKFKNSVFFASMTYDYLIVGQGLAGTCLAHQLINAGKKVFIIDDGLDLTSSKVAAGLFNPITGRKMVLTWKANQLFPYLQEFYSHLEKKLSATFYHSLSIYRPFSTIEEQNEWVSKGNNEVYKEFIKKVHMSAQYDHHIKDPFGGLELKNSGYVDIPILLGASKHYFEQQRMLLTESFDYGQLKTEGELEYKGMKYQKLIFCSGIGNNPFFSWLPFKPVKGEILEIEPADKIDKIYNRGVFIMPRKSGKCLVGSTYDNHYSTSEITLEAKNILIEKLETLLTLKYVITGQKAGIRPATKDRRPFVGLHPDDSRIAILNGLGAKGVSLAPYYSEQLTKLLNEGKDIDSEVNINRYNSLYYALQ